MGSVYCKGFQNSQFIGSRRSFGRDNERCRFSFSGGNGQNGGDGAISEHERGGGFGS